MRKVLKHRTDFNGCDYRKEGKQVRDAVLLHLRSVIRERIQADKASQFIASRSDQRRLLLIA